MTGMTTAVMVASAVVGASISAMGAIQQGKATNANAKFQAKQLEQQAGQDRASSQRVAIEKRREGDIALSNVQAAAAGAGGGATDPTVLDIQGGIAKQSEYNALSALFSGEERGRGQELQAVSSRMQGKQAQKAGLINGISTIVGGVGDAGSTLSTKYAPKKGAIEW
jgi:hypothetical protein